MTQHLVLVGIMPTDIRDRLVKRIRELRTKLIEAREEKNTEEMTALDKVVKYPKKTFLKYKVTHLNCLRSYILILFSNFGNMEKLHFIL